MLPDYTFDTKSALSALYLWLLFGFLSTMISCDLQRWMVHNQLFRHFIGIVSFFFLFTILDRTNKSSINEIWIKTIVVYCIYVLMTKSKWQFALPVLILLLIDQSINVHIKYIKANPTENKNKTTDYWTSIRYYLDIIMVVLILLGVIHYIIRQNKEFGKGFSWSKLLFVSKCSI
jgi:hypothetical protein